MIKVCLLFVCCGTFVFGSRASCGASHCYGPRGPRGRKGEKGEACKCPELREQPGNIGCPQTKYLFPNRRQTTDYIRVKTPFKSMQEYTVCAWVTPLSGRWTSTSLFSYATAASANEILLYFDSSGTFEQSFWDEYHTLSLRIDRRTHLCCVINKPGTIIYRNGVLLGSLIFSNTSPIQGGGALIIGQEQDEVLGGFDKYQALSGTVENLMVWYRSLVSGEIRNLYANPCNCPTDYAIALTPDAVQLVGGVLAQPIDQC